jgi:hypothetical protein
MDITKKAMLVSVTISNGGLLGQRKNSKASTLVQNTYHVSDKRAQASTYLIDRNHKTVKRILAASQRVREVVYRYTLPWGNENMRLIPVKTLEAFRYDVNAALKDLEDARSEYIFYYPALVAASERDLGPLFDSRQYPSQDEAKALFTAKVSYWPMPDSGHLMAEISKEAASEAKASIEAEIEERLVDASHDMVRRAREVVQAFIDKLENVKVEPSTGELLGKIHDSLIDNIRDTQKILEKLNLTENKQIKKVITDLGRLTYFSADYWRRRPERFNDPVAPYGKPKALEVANEVMATLASLDLRDKEITSMVEDASEYL